MLAWIDLETTGLNPFVDPILEIGAIVTDDDLVEIGAIQVVLGLPPAWWDWFDRDKEAISSTQLAPIVRKMHTDNGLWEECRASEISVDGACGMVLEFFQGHLGHLFPKQPLCGSSVHFDRAFLKEDMPLLESRFSHRHVDVSSFVELAARWSPKAWASRPQGETHRALPDIRRSIETLAHFRGSWEMSDYEILEPTVGGAEP